MFLTTPKCFTQHYMVNNSYSHSVTMVISMDVLRYQWLIFPGENLCNPTDTNCCNGTVIDMDYQMCCDDVVRFRPCGEVACCGTDAYITYVLMTSSENPM